MILSSSMAITFKILPHLGIYLMANQQVSPQLKQCDKKEPRVLIRPLMNALNIENPKINLSLFSMKTQRGKKLKKH
jgi:hypothetical protein